MAGINVPIGAATVEFGEGPDLVTFDITVGGITFAVNTTVQDVTVDQYGDSPVKSIMKGRTASATVPFAINDLKRLSSVIPNSSYVADTTTPSKSKITVNATAGYDLLAAAKKMVIKPSDPNATPNDWITIPLAAASADPNYTYDATNERVCKITFTAYPDQASNGLLYILGDETATGTAVNN